MRIGLPGESLIRAVAEDDAVAEDETAIALNVNPAAAAPAIDLRAVLRDGTESTTRARQVGHTRAKG